MKYNYQFIESANNYQLLLNGVVYKTYSKTRYSRQEAEGKVSDEVSKSYKRYGYNSVGYDGRLYAM